MPRDIGFELDPGELAAAAGWHPDPCVCADAIRRLADLAVATPRARSVLASALAHPSVVVRGDAVRGLVAAGGRGLLLAAQLASAAADPTQRDAGHALARRFGPEVASLAATALGDQGRDALVAQLADPARARAVAETCAVFSDHALTLRWSRWTEIAEAIHVAIEALRPATWRARVDRVAFLDDDAVAAWLDEVVAAFAGGAEPVPELVAERLARAFDARQETGDPFLLSYAVARLTVPADVTLERLLELLESGDNGERLCAVDRIVARGIDVPDARAALQRVVADENVRVVESGGRPYWDLRGGIAVRDAAEHALEALSR